MINTRNLQKSISTVDNIILLCDIWKYFIILEIVEINEKNDTKLVKVSLPLGRTTIKTVFHDQFCCNFFTNCAFFAKILKF